jgi:hypothetical protein
MQAEAERKMRRFAPGAIEAIRVGKLQGIAIGGGNSQNQAVTFRDRQATKREGSRGVAKNGLWKTRVAKNFLNRFRNPVRTGPKLRKLGRMTKERQPSAGQQAGDRSGQRYKCWPGHRDGCVLEVAV